MNSKRTRKRYNKNSKILIIMVLIVGVIGLSIGFSAFSKNLDINSTATVTPDPSNFKVLFSSSETAVETNPITPGGHNGTGTNAIIDNKDPLHPKITGMKATFTGPDQSADYSFYVRNEGKYTAYLKKIEFGKKTCTAKPGTSQILVDEVCKKTSLFITVGEQVNTKALENTRDNITNHPLEKNSSERIYLWIGYLRNFDNPPLADGDFDVEFGDITLTYSTTDS